MLVHKIFKNPMLAIGFLFMSIFVMNFLDKHHSQWPCSYIKIQLEKKVSSQVSIICKKKNLEYIVDRFSVEANTKTMYRTLVREMIFIGKSSSIEKIENVRLIISSSQLEVNLMVKGRSIAELSKIKNEKLFKKHLQRTVSVQEVVL